ncbi:MAG: GNAT family N-acetyltransferase [Burkholderiales bacterium]|nr:GNAT family N-acetyltransferase [Burkholderiales bacterium]
MLSPSDTRIAASEHREVPMLCRPPNQCASGLERHGEVRNSRPSLFGLGRIGGRSYPSELTEEIVLAGRRVTLRPIHDRDQARYDDFLSRVEPEDLRFRFGSALGEVPRSELARMTDVDYDREMAFVAATQVDGGSWEIVGDVRSHADPYGSRSEFSIVVRSDVQRLGLGRALLRKLIAYCRARRVRLLYGLVAPSNAGMLGLARELGFEVDHVPGGGTVVVSIDLRRDPKPSLAQDRAVEGETESAKLRAS